MITSKAKSYWNNVTSLYIFLEFDLYAVIPLSKLKNLELRLL